MAWLLVPDGLVWVFHNLLSYWEFHTQPFLGITKNGLKKEKHPVSCSPGGWKCLVDARGQRIMGRLIPADRRSTLTQITTRYNRGMQQSICEATTRTTLRRMGYTSRRLGLGIVWILTILIPIPILPFDSDSYRFSIPILWGVELKRVTCLFHK